MYDKVKAPSHKINHTNFVEGYLKGFGSRVGVYSNHATIIEAIKAKFNPEDNPAECAELLRRKKLLREIVGGEIDSTKGLAKPKEPWYFTHTDPVNTSTDTPETIKEKNFKNSLVANKKPYFFRYLYPEFNIKYKKYENAYNQQSLAECGLKLKKMLSKENKNPAEKRLTRKYFNHLPAITSDCIMNMLCREFENVDFDIKWNKDNYSALPSYDINEYKFDSTILGKFRKLYQKWNNQKAMSYVDSCLLNQPDYIIQEEDYIEIKFGITDASRKELQEEYITFGVGTMDALTYIKALSQSYTKFNWAFAWDLLEEDILDCIKDTDTLIPVEDNYGVEYFGRNYLLKAVSKDDKEYVIDTETGEVYFGQQFNKDGEPINLINIDTNLNISDMQELDDIDDFDIDDLLDIDFNEEEF